MTYGNVGLESFIITQLLRLKVINKAVDRTFPSPFIFFFFSL